MARLVGAAKLASLSYSQFNIAIPAGTLTGRDVLHSLTHHFSGMESWACQHKTVLEQATGWLIGEKDATDVRLSNPYFLYIVDCKAASHETRAAIDHEKGYYLFPLPMTGDTPRHVKELVLTSAQAHQEIVF